MKNSITNEVTVKSILGLTLRELIEEKYNQQYEELIEECPSLKSF